MAYIAKLNQLSDVSASSPSNGDILVYNSSTVKWENKAIGSFGLKTLTVDGSALLLDSGTTYNPGSADRTISHATTAGYKHIPTSGAAAQYLVYSSSGTAAWADFAALTVDNTILKLDSGTTFTPATARTISHVTTTGYKHIPTGGSSNQVLVWSSDGTAGWGSLAAANLPSTVLYGASGSAKQVPYYTSTGYTLTAKAGFEYDPATDILSSPKITTSGDVTVGGALTVTGNLTINGTTSTVNSTTLAVDDPLISMGVGNATDVVDLGLYGTYTPSSTHLWGGIFRDASDGVWKFFKDVQAEPTTTVNEAATGYAYAVVKSAGHILTAPASGSSSTNYVTWNSGTGALEYRSLPSGGTMSSWIINAADSVTGDYSMVDGNSLALIGDGTLITTTMANGSTLTKKITINHAASAGYFHIPAAGAAGNYLVYGGSAGTAAWLAFSALTVDNTALTLDSGTTYTPATARTISHATTTGYKHVPTGGSSTNVLVWSSDGTAAWGAVPSHTHTNMITGSLTAGRVALSSGTNTIADDSTFTFDTTAKNLYQNCGQRWAIADKASAYTLTAGDFVVTTSGATPFTITVPTALFTNTGQVWIIKQNGTGAITLDPEGTQTIDGALTYILPGQYVSVIIMVTSSTTMVIL